MVVEITNITDAPGKKPAQVDIYNRTIDPGESLKIPAELVNKKIRDLESSGNIAIGAPPSWYESFKSRKGTALTDEEKKKRIVVPAQTTPEPVHDIAVNHPEVKQLKVTSLESEIDRRRSNKSR